MNACIIKETSNCSIQTYLQRLSIVCLPHWQVYFSLSYLQAKLSTTKRRRLKRNREINQKPVGNERKNRQRWRLSGTQ